MAGRASIVGAAATHIGKVREHNEDAHFFDADAGVFLVCDGMGGHAAGEVASALAIRTIRTRWSANDTQKVVDAWIDKGSPDAKKQMLGILRAGVIAAHQAILAEAEEDESKSGMGTTVVGGMIVGNELVFAHAGDSRAYLVRDSIAMQLTEDHTLLARLLAAGIDVDVSGEGSRFRSMLTNALGIGTEVRVSVFVVSLADGDRFLFCSDGISEYVKEAEVGEVLSKQPSPARAAQKLIELALDRGGGDNATAIVVRVLEAGETPQPAEQIRRDQEVIASCPLWGTKVTPQQRLRALRIAIQRDHAAGERLPANTLGDRVAWILVEGTLAQDGTELTPGAIVYPEMLVADSQAPDRDGLAVARTEVRLLALRADDFRELCDDDNELGEALLEGLAPLIARRRERTTVRIERHRTPEIDAESKAASAAARTKTPTSPASANPAPPRPAPAAPRIALRKPAPGSIEEALKARVDNDDRVDSELDARFDAVFASEDSAAAPTQRPPSTERVPLILKPRASTDPSLVKVQAPAAIPQATRRLDSEPTVVSSAPTATGAQPSPSASQPRLPRPPTDPEIETYIEMEAEPPPAGLDPSDEPEMIVSDGDASDEPEMIVSDGDASDEPEMIVSDGDSSDEPEVIGSGDSSDARVTEIVTDTSSQTLILTIAADDDDDDDDEGDSHDPPEQLDDDDDVDRPLVRRTSEQRAAVSGTIPSDASRQRAKRLSERGEKN